MRNSEILRQQSELLYEIEQVVKKRVILKIKKSRELSK